MTATTLHSGATSPRAIRPTWTLQPSVTKRHVKAEVIPLCWGRIVAAAGQHRAVHSGRTLRSAGRTAMSTWHHRHRRRCNGLGSWTLVRYADDFVLVVN